MSPKNLALGRPSRQSSIYDGLGAGVAVDGDRSGDHYRKCSCTQQDPQGWWEVDLGQLVHVQQVKVRVPAGVTRRECGGDVLLCGRPGRGCCCPTYMYAVACRVLWLYVVKAVLCDMPRRLSGLLLV